MRIRTRIRRIATPITAAWDVQRDVADLLVLYGVHDPDEREAWLSLAMQANAPDWWHGYSDVLPPWFEMYIGLEQAASLIRAYEVQVITDLLQTEAYARAVTLLEHAKAGEDPEATEHEVERRVSMCMRRRQLLSGEDPPRLWVVVDEVALRRPVGGRRGGRRAPVIDHRPSQEDHRRAVALTSGGGRRAADRIVIWAGVSAD